MLSSFIGRAREVDEVLRLLRSERLVSLTGAGGSGKTRLALQVAHLALPNYRDGAWLTELAPLSDERLVPQAVAATFDLAEHGRRPLRETLAEALRPRHTLLILDNCEHLLQACAQLAHDLLRACPELTILATSREALGVPGEVLRIVPPLSLPEATETAGGMPGEARRTSQSEAVQLFVRRAQAAAPDFALTDENARSVAQICLRLDGMPLAIELAAARLRALSAAEVAALLGDRFQLLTGGSRTAPARQRTLEAALDWSYALLTDAEQRVLQSLSVFAGGCTLEAAEAVCGAGGNGAESVREILAHLVDKSLLSVDRSGEAVRYEMLETIREYGRRKLPETEAAGVRERHLKFFVEWAERLEPMLQGQELRRGVELFAGDHANVRQALDWSEQPGGSADLGLRLAAAAWNYWRVMGFHTEGRGRLGRLLGHLSTQAPTYVRAHALLRAALHAFYQSDYPACKSLAEQALRICEGLGRAGRNGMADALEILAEVASETGDYDVAVQRFQAALPIYVEVGDLTGQGDTLKMLGFQAMRSGDLQTARGWLERGLEVCRQAGDLRHIASALSGMGELAIRTGNYADARAHLNESLSMSRRTGEKWSIAINLGSLGWVAMLEGDLPAMVAALRESLAIRIETGDVGGIAWCLEKLTQAAVAAGRMDTAARIAGAAEALRRPSGSQMDGPDRPVFEAALQAVRLALGDEGFEKRRAAGAKMPLDEVIELALEEIEAAGAARQPSGARPGGLTERELETAQLIAQGKSNREIAGAMTVSVKTAETYVTRILNKLGFDSRVQVATWAMEQGLMHKEQT